MVESSIAPAARRKNKLNLDANMKGFTPDGSAAMVITDANASGEGFAMRMAEIPAKIGIKKSFMALTAAVSVKSPFIEN